MDKDTKILVANRDNGVVSYSIPEYNIVRNFEPRESKEITFDELEKLTFQLGGQEILSEFLVIRNEEAAKELLHNVEPEYFYTKQDVVSLLKDGSLDAFLDCLDFAPIGVIDEIKALAVDLPLTDTNKRDAILEKTGFNVTRAIEIKNTKYDGETEEEAKDAEKKTRTRRVSTTENTATETPKPARRVATK